MKEPTDFLEAYRVEYLVVVNTNGGFCNSIKSFNSLLSTYEDIVVDAKGLTFSGLRVSYEIDTDVIGRGEQRYFHLKLTLPSNESLDEFSQLTRLIKTILHKVADTAPQILWDDISIFYAHLAYPHINSVENLMRKLITKFMLTTLGVHWEKMTLPDEVKQSVRSEPRKDSNYLYESDFIQLSNFLFTTYSNVPILQLLTKIEESKDISELQLDELKQFVPRSNWERYFSPIVDCSSEYLSKKWKQLYELRCKIAHNRTFGKSDLQRVETLVKEVSAKLEDALSNLERVQISEDERDIVAENMVGNLSAAYGEFLQNWKELVSFLNELVSVTDSGMAAQLEYYKYQHNVPALLKALRESQILDDETCERINEFRKYRNALVHRTDVVFSKEDVYLAANRVKDEIFEISATLSDSILMDWASNYQSEEANEIEGY